MLSLWRWRGRQDGVALVLSTKKPCSYGACSDDEGELETASGPRSWLVKRFLATWWRFVAGMELPPIVFRRPGRKGRVIFIRSERFIPQGNLLAARSLKSVCDERGGSYLTVTALETSPLFDRTNLHPLYSRLAR
jgi:hypothetical protein